MRSKLVRLNLKKKITDQKLFTNKLRKKSNNCSLVQIDFQSNTNFWILSVISTIIYILKPFFKYAYQKTVPSIFI